MFVLLNGSADVYVFCLTAVYNGKRAGRVFLTSVGRHLLAERERERAILHFFGHRMSSISGKLSSKTLVGNGSIAPCDDQQ